MPRAQRSDKPVYIDGNPLSGSYRRNGEGDYKCTKEEVQAMMRDAAIKTQDMLVLENMELDAFDYDSVKRYRIRMKTYRPGHVGEELEDVEFLYKLGAVGRSSDGKMHPTAAGLLMFGYEYEIVKEFPAYFLDYQEQFDPSTRWTDRIVSSSGDWSGNIYDFYFRVYNKITQDIKIKITQDIKIPFKLEGGDRIDDTQLSRKSWVCSCKWSKANMLLDAAIKHNEETYNALKKAILQVAKQIKADFYGNRSFQEVIADVLRDYHISEEKNVISFYCYSQRDSARVATNIICADVKSKKLEIQNKIDRLNEFYSQIIDIENHLIKK